MGLSQILFARLTGAPDAAAVTDLVSDRVMPGLAPMYLAGSYPQIVYELGDRDNNETFDGPSGLVTQRARLHCVAEDPDAAQSLAAAVRPLFNGTTGTWAGSVIQGAFVEDERDEDVYIDTDAGEQRKLFGVYVEVLIAFEV